MLTIKEYVKVKSLEEAFELNQKRSNRIIGGMLWLKMGDRTIQKAIDLSGLGLDKIEETEDAFRIGCMTSLREVEEHPGFAAYTGGAAKEALRHIVGVQFRNLATVGGSIFGRFGFSDVLTLFLALDTYVELHQGGIVPLKDFVSMKKDNDILVRLIVKKRPVKISYQSMRITKTDFPVLCTAVSLMDGVVQVAVGARPGRAVLVKDEQGLLTGGITRETSEAFAHFIREQVPTGKNMRAGAEYRSILAEVQVKRALREIGGGDNAD